jgi:hypothetical protein
MTYTKFFQFTLVLKNVNEHTKKLEDSLFKANCDDALINYRSGAVYLDFDREAISFEDAVISAIKDVQSASISIEVESVAPENLVTEAEIAKRLKKSRQTISLWITGERRKQFPHPVMRLAEKSPLWSWYDITLWLYENNIIQDRNIIENALFIVNVNAALQECDKKTRQVRQKLIKKIASYSLQHHR